MMEMNKNSRLLLVSASIAGALAVALGAFGAHALKPVLVESGRLETFNTAVSYHFYHSLALLAVGILSLHLHYKFLVYAGYCFLLGTLLFSGSLYVISIWKHLSFLGIITPVGGVFLISAWSLLAISVIRNSSK